MNQGYLFLFIIFSLGILSKSDLLILASTILFFVKIIKFDSALLVIDGVGIKLGLIFLVMSVMVPLIDEKFSIVEVVKNYKSMVAVFAVISGILATKMVQHGLILLDREPELIIAMLLGSIVGIVFFDGVPVGPLIAAGLTTLFYRIYSLFID